jgi:hypothetical protein
MTHCAAVSDFALLRPFPPKLLSFLSRLIANFISSSLSDSKMSKTSSVDTAFALIKDDPSKVLGVRFGTHDVTTGGFLGRAGKSPQ